MNSHDNYLLVAIFVGLVATFLTRALPFILFDKQKDTPKILFIFEKYMPFMIMVILIFYAIRDTKFLEFPYGLPEIIGILCAAFLHIKFKNALLSILGATFFYMILIQVVMPYFFEIQ
jgi:branched-subunit amino acid transport protein AzlD